MTDKEKKIELAASKYALTIFNREHYTGRAEAERNFKSVIEYIEKNIDVLDVVSGCSCSKTGTCEFYNKKQEDWIHWLCSE